MQIKIVPNDKGNPPGKLADAELHFTDGPLNGLKLIGFGIWERRGGANAIRRTSAFWRGVLDKSSQPLTTPSWLSGRNVTFPARQYSVNGERRSLALLRPIVDVEAQHKVRDLILEAYDAWEAEQTPESAGQTAESQGFRIGG